MMSLPKRSTLHIGILMSVLLLALCSNTDASFFSSLKNTFGGLLGQWKQIGTGALQDMAKVAGFNAKKEMLKKTNMMLHPCQFGNIDSTCVNSIRNFMQLLRSGLLSKSNALCQGQCLYSQCKGTYYVLMQQLAFDQALYDERNPATGRLSTAICNATLGLSPSNNPEPPNTNNFSGFGGGEWVNLLADIVTKANTEVSSSLGTTAENGAQDNFKFELIINKLIESTKLPDSSGGLNLF